MDLVRSGREIPAAYYENAVSYIEKNINADGQLSSAEENARMILALTTLGKDVTNVAGHNLLQGLSNLEYVTKQGLSGEIWAMIALDSHAYTVPDAPAGVRQTTREKLISSILAAQLENGGWALSENTADAATTAMAVQALAPYYGTRSDVKAAVDKALALLSEMQNTVGGFGTGTEANSQSCAQVIIALTALGVDPAKDTRFIKNGRSVVDVLCSCAADGGFSLVPGGNTDPTATELGYRGLAAYFRFLGGQTPLFNMNDVKIEENVNPVEPPKPTDPVEPAEPVDPSAPTAPTDPDSPSKPTDPTDPAVPSKPVEPVAPNKPTSPTTGDNSNAALYARMLTGSAMALATLMYFSRKKKYVSK